MLKGPSVYGRMCYLVCYLVYLHCML